MEEQPEEEYIPLEKCKARSIYELDSRNLDRGVYNPETKGFIGIRQKFSSLFLFSEDHWDAGPPYGTAKPLKELATLPDDIQVCEGWHKDLRTNREIEFDKEAKIWYYRDSREKNKEIQPIWIENDALFNFLKQN